MKYLITYFVILLVSCILYQQFYPKYKFKAGQCVFTNVSGTKLIKHITKTSWGKYYYSMKVYGDYMKEHFMRREFFEALHDEIECPK